MSARADQHQVRRWQEEIARDPASESFLPLAEVYRREGRLDVARRLCIRGLRHFPENVDAHFLLGRLHRQAGELDQAFDEWDITLRLDPAHRPARRALGYLCLERRDWEGAVRHLGRLAGEEPLDERAASALALARRHAGGGAPVVVGAERLEDAVAGPIERFVRATRVRRLLLCDAAGRVLAQQGFARELDMAALATLGAGIHSASGQVARLLGQPRFDQLYQGRGERQIFLAPVQSPAGELILLCVFGQDTTIGLVRVLFRDLARELADLPWLPPALQVVDAAAFEAELAAGLERLPGGGRPRLLR
jgi:tetratricopeptide (TPR) repeat protein